MILFFTFSLPLLAGNKIEVRANNVTQVILPGEIEYFKGGFLPEDFLIEQIRNVLYITPVYAGVNKTNVCVVTKNGMYFSLDIIYNEDVATTSYLLNPSEAFYKADNTITHYARDSTPIHQVIKDTLSRLVDNILKEEGFITTNNTVRYKNFFFFLKGIYVCDNTIFIRLNANNKSNIKFDFDYVAFYINTEKRKKNTSSEQLQLFPTKDFNFINSLESGRNQDIVFAFNKFTIGSGKILNIDLIEKDGERNLSIKIDDRLLLDAKKIDL